MERIRLSWPAVFFGLCALIALAGCGGDHNETFGQTETTARAVGPNSQTSGSLASPQEADVFRITLTSPGTLTVRTTGSTDTLGLLMRALTGCPASGSIVDASCGDPIFIGDDEDKPNFRIVAHSLPAGTYFVVVETFAQAGSYTLISSFTPNP